MRRSAARWASSRLTLGILRKPRLPATGSGATPAVRTASEPQWVRRFRFDKRFGGQGCWNPYDNHASLCFGRKNWSQENTRNTKKRSSVSVFFTLHSVRFAHFAEDFSSSFSFPPASSVSRVSIRMTIWLRLDHAVALRGSYLWSRCEPRQVHSETRSSAGRLSALRSTSFFGFILPEVPAFSL